jgi:hypothetical protein
MKAIDLLLNSYLPEDLRDYSRQYDKKGLHTLMADIAKKHPDKYRELSKVISDTGRNASYIQGETLTLSDMRPTYDKTEDLNSLDVELDDVKKALPRSEHEAARLKLYQKYSDLMGKKTIGSAISGQHGLANTVFSGARGSPTQLAAMITTPGMYTDYANKPIDMFVRRSFGEGLRPYEYLASMFGARKGVLATKEATADAGYLGKQMARATLPIVVTQNKCSCNNGINVEVDNIDDMMGRVLVNDTQGIPSGTAVDRKILNSLSKSKIKRVIVRSPMTCQAKEGVCAEAAGLGNDGKFPVIGDAVGLTAAQALSEPITQGSLNTKHTGGMYSDKTTFAGFNVINQIMQAPSTFPNRASVAEVFGTVEQIEEAPQGGKFIYVDGHRHYALPGFDTTVKTGDSVEPGDQLSAGIVDVKDIIRLRGLGEGRQHYVNRLEQAFNDSGMQVDRRNLEYLARGALDQVRVTGNEGLGDNLPDDLVSYNKLNHGYNPPATSKVGNVGDSIGKYLETPALHYSIGTKLTPRMVSELNESGVKRVFTSEDKPKFEPLMTMLSRSTKHNEDWLAKMHDTYLGASLKDDSVIGADTDIEQNIHFAPRLAYGDNFGDKARTTGKF